MRTLSVQVVPLLTACSGDRADDATSTASLSALASVIVDAPPETSNVELSAAVVVSPDSFVDTRSEPAAWFSVTNCP